MTGIYDKINEIAEEYDPKKGWNWREKRVISILDALD